MKTPMSAFVRHFFTAIAAFIVLISVGTLGFTLLEHWPFFDSLYMTIITVSTVGFGEIHPLHDSSRLFTIFLILSSIGIVGYLLGSFTQMLIVGELMTLLGRKRVEKQIGKLSNHVIVCGHGRVGSILCAELAKRDLEHVVIEHSEDIYNLKDREKTFVIRGNAVEDDVLLAAGIMKAKALVTTLPSDPDNVFITLASRGLKKDIFIVSRASKEASINKLIAAGANRVVSPHRMGATMMASLLLKPTVTDFLDSAWTSGDLPLEFGEIFIPNGSPYCGVSLGKSGIRQELDLIIVSIKKGGGHTRFNPNAATIIEPGDVLIALGAPENLVQLSSKVASNAC